MNSFYHDPLGSLPEGKAYERNWIACAAQVMRHSSDEGHEAPSGLVVIVQEDYASGMETVSRLGSRLLWGAAIALGLVGATIVALWLLVLRMLHEPAKQRPVVRSSTSDPTPINQSNTLSETKPMPLPKA